MGTRRLIQQADERLHVNNFLSRFNRSHRSDFRVVQEPNPPEAIVRSSRGTIRWIEVTTALWNRRWAEDIISYANPDESYKPIDKGPYRNVTDEFNRNFVGILQKKLGKKSYVDALRKYGPGYLIIAIRHPFYLDINNLRKYWATTVDDMGCFRSVFVTFRSLNEYRFSRLPIISPASVGNSRTNALLEICH